MGLPGKVCDLCQICNWARTMTQLTLRSPGLTVRCGCMGVLKEPLHTRWG